MGDGRAAYARVPCVSVFWRACVWSALVALAGALAACDEASSDKEITAFELHRDDNAGLAKDLQGVISENNIAITVPPATDVTMLRPFIKHTGASIDPASGAPQDFTQPVTYTVTAADGSSMRYTVTVSIEASSSSSKDITGFSVAGVDATVQGTSITVTLPFGTDVSELTPTVIFTGSDLSPKSGAKQDFSKPVEYTVTAADGSTKRYTVTINVAKSNAKEITKFKVAGVEANISGSDITVSLSYGTDVASLVPEITHTGSAIAPVSGAAADFSKPATYTVTAADGSTKVYTVTVSVALSNAKDITRFKILGFDAQIGSDSITLTLPYATNLTSLQPSIEFTGMSVSPESGLAQNFTSPVTYTVTAPDGSTKSYVVTIELAASDAKDITSFSVLGVSATITGSNIDLTLPFGTDVTALAPTISHTGASVSPASGVAHDFSSLVTYTVSAADGSTRDYTISVHVAASSTKEITHFSILGFDAQINSSSISIVLPSGTSLVSLTPSITLTGASVSPASGIPQDFTDPVTYTVTAANGSTKDYTVTISVALNSAKDITDFDIGSNLGQISGNNISVTVPYGTNVTSLTPTITHTGASVSPADGVSQDFTNPVTYTVTAADSSTKNYTVTVNVALNSAKDITQFTILGADGVISGNTINVTVPYGTDVSALTPTLVHTGANVSPSSGSVEDFSSPVTYKVTAADSSTKDYTVTVHVALNSAKDITQFTILGIDANIINNAISLTVPYGTNVTSLTPTITHTGASVNPANGVGQDFTSPVMYTVTAANGSTKNYTVTVNVALNSAKDITQFTILGIDANITNNAISLTVPYGTDVTALTPTITHTGASTNPASGVAQDFTTPVTYTVTAADSSTKNYTVTVNVALNSAKDITQFTILGADGVISGNTINVTVPYGTDVSALTPTLVHTGANVSPSSGSVEDFSSPVTYRVTAADSSTKDYTVTVHVALNSAKDITQFTILGIDANIINNAISLTVPYGTNVTSLTPTITHTGASVNPADSVSQDFTNPVTYTVTAANGSSKDYTVTISVALNSAKDITGFDIGSNLGQISGNDISVTVPYGTNVTSLTPTIMHTGASVNPADGVSQDFTNPVMYTVTAADSSTKNYTVTVNVALNSAKAITGFSISGNAGSINGTMIAVTVPYGTDVTSLAPTIVHTGASVNPSDGATADFTNPVMYTVTAADSSTQNYTVTVTVAPSMSKDITQFTIAGVDGMIGTNSIGITLPYGTDVTALTPMITHSGATVSPDTGVAQDFSNPVMYTVTAADNSTKIYTVTVAIAANAAPVLSGGPFSHDASVVNGDVIGTMQLTDGDIGQMHTFMITSDTSGSGFAIDSMSGVISVADATALSAGSYTVGVSATDDGVPPATGNLSVSITLATPPMAVADTAATALATVATTIDLAANDALGTPTATFTSFGGGSLGGAVTDHPADGSTVTLAGGTIALDAAGTLTVNAATAGVYTFNYRLSNGASSDAAVTLTICTNMSVGSMVIARPEDQPIACFGTTENVTSQYVFVPMNLTTSAAYSITAAVSGATAIMGGAAPTTGPASATDTAHSTFRASEHTEVSSRAGVPGGGSGTPVTPAASIPTGVPSVGDSWSLNNDVSTACSTGTATTGTVKYVGTYSIIVADTVNMPAGGFSDQQYQVIAWNFDNIIYPSVTAALGAPPDSDNNARVVLFVTPAMNALSPPASSTAFYAREMPRDLLSQTDCPTSNVGEIIYLLAPDPTGTINSNVRTVSAVGGNDSGGFLAHEFAHLIVDGRRLANGSAFEEPWLDEGIAGLAEDLSFFVGSGWGVAAVSTGTSATFPTTNSAGMTEGANVALGTNATSGVQLNSKRVASFNTFENPLYTRYKAWVSAPRSVGILGPTSDTTAQRGAAYMFLRYLDDRISAGNYATGDMFISNLVDSNLTGMTNIASRINADPKLWLRDYLLAIYIDDSAISNLDIAMSTYRIASWNWRSLGSALGGYLQDAVFTDLTPVTFTLAGDGTATYTRFAVASGSTATLSLTPPAGTWDAWYAVFRRQ